MFGRPLKKSPSFSSPKRKPFVSTTKKVSTFGAPPPLPPRPRSTSPDKMVHDEAALLVETPVYNMKEKELSDPHPPDETALNAANLLRLQQQSVRWLNLSSSLWSMIVISSNRAVDKKGIGNILTAMMWRLHGTISEEEFTGLFLEWMGKGNFQVRKNPSKCGVFVIRNVLLEQNITEENLDVLLGMTIYEINRRLLSSPLSFNVLSGESPTRKPNLEVCSKRWLSLSEELFFMLDTPGFGYISLDEFFFLAASLMVAKREWSSEAEAEQCFSIQTLAAAALHMMREAGATMNCSNIWADEGKDSSDAEYMGLSHPSFTRSPSSPITYNHSGHRVRPQPPSISEDFLTRSYTTPFADNSHIAMSRQSSGQYVSGFRKSAKTPPDTGPWVSLPMFKLFMMKQGLGEAALLSLITLIKECTQLIANISEEKNVHVLHRACRSYGGGASRGDIGPPKIWHSCVYGVSGYPPPDVEERQNVQLPPVLLFLLSDAQRHIPGAWVAALPPDALDDDDIGTAFRDAYGATRTKADLQDEEDLLIHYTSFELWTAFSAWGDDGSQRSTDPYAATRARKDSVYQFMMSIASEYKSSLLLLCAAFVDIAMDHFSTGIAVVGAGRNSAAGVAAASLLPGPVDCVKILQEMFPETSQLQVHQPPPPLSTPSAEDYITHSDFVSSDRDSDEKYNYEADKDDGLNADAKGAVISTDDLETTPAVRTVYTTNDESNSDNKRTRDVNKYLLKLKALVPQVSKQISSVQDSSRCDFGSWLEKTGGSEDWEPTVLNDINSAMWASVFDTKEPVVIAPKPTNSLFDMSQRSMSNTLADDSAASTNGTSIPAGSPAPPPSEHNSLSFSERRRSRRRKQGGLMSSRMRRREPFPHENTKDALLDELAYCTSERERDVLIDQLKQIRQKEALDRLYSTQTAVTGDKRQHNTDEDENEEQEKQYELPPPSLSTQRESYDSTDSKGLVKGRRQNHRELSGDERRRQSQATHHTTTPTSTSNFQESPSGDETQNLSAQAVSSLKAAVEAMEAIKRSQERSVPLSKNDHHESSENDTKRGNNMTSVEQWGSNQRERYIPNQSDAEANDSPASKVALSEASSLASSVVEMLEKGQTAGLYAQSLRDLLRKMSRDDAHMQLKSLEKIIELGNSIMQNEAQKQSTGRQSHRQGASVTPPSKLQQRATRDQVAAGITPQSSRSRSPDKPAWSKQTSTPQSPAIVANRSSYETSKQWQHNEQSKLSRGGRENGAMLLGGKSPSSRESPAESNQSWGADGEQDTTMGSSLLGNDTVRRATVKKRIPGMEPKGRKRHVEKPFGGR